MERMSDVLDWLHDIIYEDDWRLYYSNSECAALAQTALVMLKSIPARPTEEAATLDMKQLFTKFCNHVASMTKEELDRSYHQAVDDSCDSTNW